MDNMVVGPLGWVKVDREAGVTVVVEVEGAEMGAEETVWEAMVVVEVVQAANLVDVGEMVGEEDIWAVLVKPVATEALEAHSVALGIRGMVQMETVMEVGAAVVVVKVVVGEEEEATVVVGED